MAEIDPKTHSSMDIRAIILISILCYISYYGNAEQNTATLSKEEELEIEDQLKQLNKPAVKTIQVILIFSDGVIYNCVDFFKQPAFDHPLLKNHNFHYKHAVLRTKPGKRYNGGGVIMSLHNLSTIVRPQYSASQMTIKNGLDTIQVGWMVNPSLYGDSKTRLFTFFQAGGRSCFNTHCPGFVIVNTEIPLDFVFNSLSQRGERPFITRLFVYRDAANGNWWLLLGNSGTEIGFWPGRIFSSLNSGLGNYVEWGGEAYSPLGQPKNKNTPMGNGFRPKGDTTLDAFMEQITTIDESHKQVIATNTEVFSDNKSLYDVRDWGLEGTHGHMISFGGPFISAAR
ncbi:protein neprosin-like [Humulus lupulus]|uniref:protein neprosin-like n=1 Tax=Humulus lupulus TaxID=3486 RepID=UPI002B40A7AA|nr:protein neprosin-like [Humulus lupulus]